MPNDQDEIAKIINALLVPLTERQALLQQLEEQGVSKDLFAQVSQALQKSAQLLKDKFPEEIKDLVDYYEKKNTLIKEEESKLAERIQKAERHIRNQLSDITKKAEEQEMRDLRDRLDKA